MVNAQVAFANPTYDNIADLAAAYIWKRTQTMHVWLHICVVC